jgi:molybdopterin converting factor small subunit
MEVIFELYGVLEHLAGGQERRLTLADTTSSVSAALQALAADAPQIEAHLQHCACAADGQVIRRSEPLPTSGRIALLPPVGGG